MEFCQKLQELRKQKGFTQEELAELLFVSRTAVSKWESGRGYPNIESLKAIAKVFWVTIDELLSGQQVLTIAEEENKQKERHFRDLVFALLDLSCAMFFFLPLFGEAAEGAVRAVSLPAFSGIAPYLKIAYFVAVLAMVAWGTLTLALRGCRRALWQQSRSSVSLLLNATGTLLFIVSLQPYAAAFLFLFLIIKGLILFKRR